MPYAHSHISQIMNVWQLIIILIICEYKKLNSNTIRSGSAIEKRILCIMMRNKIINSVKRIKNVFLFFHSIHRD